MSARISESELSTELNRIYSARFSGLEIYRNEVWRVLVPEFFQQWIRPQDSVLDLGCGYGEFINNVQAAKKYAMDLNPASSKLVDSKTCLFQQDCSAEWPLPADSLDVVFTSNFFEHLPNKTALQATLLEARKCLKPKGLLIAIGPNVKLLSGEYWDFFDHHLPLTELSLSEALVMAGYQVEHSVAKFLPYTMSQGFRPPIWTIKLYLRSKTAWRIFGRQFFVVARKS